MSNWFKVYQQSINPKLRIFAFPYAGGSAQIFANWVDHLPNDIDLYAIQSPGRGRRFSEKPIACLKTKLKILHREILPFTNIPYIFIGHSNGALLAYELARELQKSGNCNLLHLVLSAKRAPHLPSNKTPIHDLPQPQFLAEIKNYNFTPDEVLENKELMSLFIPMLRADFSLSDTHQFDQKIALHTNASLYWGNQDKDVPVRDVKAWQDLIIGQTELVEFNDGHFFISTQSDLFLTRINRLINTLT